MASHTTSTSSVLLVLVLVAMGGLGDLAAAARPVDEAALSAAKYAMASSAGGAADGAELDGMMECMIGCFMQVMSCAFGCMGKGPDLPLCVISCNQESIVCMMRCGLTPSPPGPTPPGPSPKPPVPKPPGPPCPPGPPYSGHNTETSA